MVKVSGRNLAPAAVRPGFVDGDLVCRFGGPHGKVALATPVRGSDAVECETPPNSDEGAGTEVGKTSLRGSVRQGRDRNTVQLVVVAISIEGTSVVELKYLCIKR